MYIKKNRWTNVFRIICFLMIGLLAFVGCNKEDEGQFAYPCYGSREVEGLTAVKAYEIFQNADLLLRGDDPRQVEEGSCLITKSENVETILDAITFSWYPSNDRAEEMYLFLLGSPRAEMSAYEIVRISNFTLESGGEFLQEAMITLGLWSNKVKIPLSVKEQVTISSMMEQDFLRIRDAMKADGYLVCPCWFEAESHTSFTMINQEGTRMFIFIEVKDGFSAEELAYTRVEEEKIAGLPLSQYTVIGTSKIVCAVGDTFSEIEGYFR